MHLKIVFFQLLCCHPPRERTLAPIVASVPCQLHIGVLQSARLESGRRIVYSAGAEVWGVGQGGPSVCRGQAAWQQQHCGQAIVAAQDHGGHS